MRSVRTRSHAVTGFVAIVPGTLLAAPGFKTVALAQPVQFFDDFDRVDAGGLGNDWEARPGDTTDFWTLTGNEALMTFSSRLEAPVVLG